VDLKHKVDVAGTLVDKTRGKIALGRIEQRLTRLDREIEDDTGQATTR
jgi:predicted translin family RNA/ssDNA-binding protein